VTVFVDTSALFALLDAEDAGNASAFPAWSAGIDDGVGFVTSNYVLVETLTLVQSRLGMDAVRVLVAELLPMIHTLWVTDADHSAAQHALLAASRRRLSFVDCVSFTLMRRLGIREYLGLGPHFEEQGFTQYEPAG
jgi:predicted nucleic acid-binding protein